MGWLRAHRNIVGQADIGARHRDRLMSFVISWAARAEIPGADREHGLLTVTRVISGARALLHPETPGICNIHYSDRFLRRQVAWWGCGPLAAG